MSALLLNLSDSDRLALKLLAAAMLTNETECIRRLLRCAVADTPEIRSQVLADFRDRMERKAASVTESVAA
jgi:hypothetical protein